MMNNLYTKKVIQHFKNPQNMGEIKNPDGVTVVGNPVCGDVMKMYLRIGQRKVKNSETEEYVKDIKFQTLGCAAAIATSSIVTQLIKGKSLKEALKITNQDVVKALGGLPKVKLHCSVLAVAAFKKAVKNYQEKRGKR